MNFFKVMKSINPKKLAKSSYMYFRVSRRYMSHIICVILTYTVCNFYFYKITRFDANKVAENKKREKDEVPSFYDPKKVTYLINIIFRNEIFQ